MLLNTNSPAAVLEAHGKSGHYSEYNAYPQWDRQKLADSRADKASLAHGRPTARGHAHSRTTDDAVRDGEATVIRLDRGLAAQVQLEAVLVEYAWKRTPAGTRIAARGTAYCAAFARLLVLLLQLLLHALLSVLVQSHRFYLLLLLRRRLIYWIYTLLLLYS